MVLRSNKYAKPPAFYSKKQFHWLKKSSLFIDKKIAIDYNYPWQWCLSVERAPFFLEIHLKEIVKMKTLGYYNGKYDEIENMVIPMKSGTSTISLGADWLK